jgi:hypothetical protein
MLPFQGKESPLMDLTATVSIPGKALGKLPMGCLETGDRRAHSLTRSLDHWSLVTGH